MADARSGAHQTMKPKRARSAMPLLAVLAIVLSIVGGVLSPLKALADTDQYGYEKNTGAGTGYVYNWPSMDDPHIVLQKVDKQGSAVANDDSLDKNGNATVEGAEFTMKFYGEDTSTINSVADLSGKTPLKTWVFKTDADGDIFYTPDYKVSGDDLYAMVDPETHKFISWALPLGVFTVQETKAPAGYIKTDTTYLAKVVKGADGIARTEKVVWPDASSVLNEDAEGRAVINQAKQQGVKVGKVDVFFNTGDNEGDGKMAENLTFEIRAAQDFEKLQVGGISANRAKADGDMHNVKTNDLIYTIKGSEIKTETINGVKYVTGTTSPDLLTPGKYYIVEGQNPTGYLMNEDWRVDFTVDLNVATHRTIIDLVKPENALKDTPIMGAIRVDKSDLETTHSNPQGDATFEGAEFTVYNVSANPIGYQLKTKVANGTGASDANKVTTITVKKDGNAYFAETPAKSLPYGTYLVKETKAPTGYQLNEDWAMTVKVREDGAVYKVGDAGVTITGSKTAETSIPEQVWRGGLAGIKFDVERDETIPQGDATLKGAKIMIKNISGEEVMVKGDIFPAGADITNLVLTTKADGSFTTGKRDLPYGTYELREIEPSTGYLLNEGWRAVVEVHPNSKAEDGTIYKVREAEDLRDSDNLPQEPVRGGVKVGKVNLETMTYDEPGKAKLSGAEFTIYNISNESIVYDQDRDGFFDAKGEDVLKANRQAVMTIVTERTEDGKFVAETAARDLPYGRYFVVETKPSEGFLLNEEWVKYFSIGYKAEGMDFWTAGDGEVVDITDELDACPDQVKRYDDRFVKKLETKDDSNMKEMPSLGFVIIGRTNGEAHLYVTDRNGILDTVRVDHSVNTNASDAAIDTDAAWQLAMDGLLDKLPEELGIEEIITVNEEAMGYQQGYWFTGYKTGSDLAAKVKVNDSLGAVVYEDYVIYELRTSGNQDVVLMRNELNIDDIDRMGWQYDRGTMDNFTDVYDPKIATRLVNVEGEHIAAQGESERLIDTVSYSDFREGSYRLDAELHVVNEDGTDGGVVATGSATFSSVAHGNGTVEVPIDVNTLDLAGKKLVCFETATATSGKDEGKAVAEHKDLTDEDQTVTVPSIGTTLTGTESGDHDVNGSERIKLTDTVAYEGLETGKAYKMEAELHVRDAEGNDKGILRDIYGNEVRASQTFTAKESSGTVDVIFDFMANADEINGSTVVAFETLTRRDIELASHARIDDDAQAVFIPKVETKAWSEATELRLTPADAEVKIYDEVHYSNLIVGKEYTIKGELHLKGLDGSDMGILNDPESGEPIMFEKAFTAEQADGVELMEVTIDASLLAGREAVFFERIERDGYTVGIHADITDDTQTPTFPKVETTATVKETQSQALVAGTTVTINDEVAYSGLIPGLSYVLEGEVHIGKATEEGVEDMGVALGPDGSPAAARIEFGVESSSGTITVPIKLDTESLGDNTVAVVFEKLYIGTLESEKLVEIARHEDINDSAQSVYQPKIQTEALDAATQTHSIPSSGMTTITDYVTYDGLIVGKEYTMNATYHIKNDDGTDGGLVRDADGNPVTGSTTFTAEAPAGVVEVKTVVDASLVSGKTLVAFEDAYSDGVRIAVHANINDEAQTVYVTEIGTTLTGEDGESKTVMAGSDVSMVDHVEYKNFNPGTEYTMAATLHLIGDEGEDLGELRDAEGIVITASKVFTPDEANGIVDVTFESVDTSKLNGRKLVAFETASTATVDEEGKPSTQVVAEHKDINDEAQTIEVYSPSIRTVLTDGLGKKDVSYNETITLVDTVTYEGIRPGQEYTMAMTIMDKATAEPLMVDGKPLTAEAKFTPEAADGSVEVSVKVKGEDVIGKALVAFEELKLTATGEIIAEHKDINDEDQTVKVNAPEIATTLTDNSGRKNVAYGEKITLVDTVKYSGLTPGLQYELAMTLMDKSTGKSTGYTATAKFNADKADGEAKVEVTVNGSDVAGKSIVAFEELKLNGKLIAEHKDLNDADQTVTIEKAPEGSTPRTVQRTGAIAAGVIAAVTLTASVAGLVYIKRRGKADGGIQ